MGTTLSQLANPYGILFEESYDHWHSQTISLISGRLLTESRGEILESPRTRFDERLVNYLAERIRSILVLEFVPSYASGSTRSIRTREYHELAVETVHILIKAVSQLDNSHSSAYFGSPCTYPLIVNDLLNRN